MSDGFAHPAESDSNLPLADRRKFLTGVGLAACTGLLATDLPATNSAQAFQAAAPKRKKPAATSGVDGIKDLLAAKDPICWVFTGDSITHGALHTKGFRSYPEHFAERVRWEMKRMRDIVINTGISGDKADGLLADLDWRVLHLKPDVVSIMIGMNDCTLGEVGRELFRKNLTAIVNKVKAGGAIPILNTPNTIYLKNAETRGDLPAYAQIIRDVALGTKAVLIDHYAHWETVKPDQESLVKWLEDKSIHPGAFGHREFAKKIFNDLGIYDEKSPTCQLPVE
ncbi:MAG TPA: SGNH/GDSL hydrolase family protein [Planctomycetaceae bacterium]